MIYLSIKDSLIYLSINDIYDISIYQWYLWYFYLSIEDIYGISIKDIYGISVSSSSLESIHYG